jgi:formate dehydrogenase major subunit
VRNSDCILIMGSNMAECHPVGFQWVVEAKLEGARVIHVDPRFTRTSALADLHVPIRAGSDIAFLGGIVNHILEHGRDFREYVLAYTNASTILDERFQDTEDLDGLFSGWDSARRAYDDASWQYKGRPLAAAVGSRERGSGPLTRTGDDGNPNEIKRDDSLQDPRCVYQVLKRHFARYTPELVEEACGVPRERFLEVAEALCANSGRERTSVICYAVGWTQHTVGVQNVRTAAIIQLLLGNVGRPGGGIIALRGHSNIQGATDISTLFDLLPGYLPMPEADKHPDLATYVRTTSAQTGFWGGMDAYITSLLKAYWGDHATADNDYRFDYLPRVNGDHSTYQVTLAMLAGDVKGYFALGENPAVGSANSGAHRFALANLDWLVVRDLVEIETAAFWYDSPEVQAGKLDPASIKTEVFLLPAAAHTEKDGSFTNTQRLLQWHGTAVEPPGDCRSDLWFTYHLGRLVREKLAASEDPKDRPIQQLAWDYPTIGERAEPSAEAVLREINGWGQDGKALSGYTELRADGSTTCGGWIYCGSFAGELNQPNRREASTEGDVLDHGWGWAWPMNRRILYNRASADPRGAPWSERKRLLWWDDRNGRWTGDDVPDFERAKPPDYVPGPGALGPAALGGGDPFIMQADGRGWLHAPSGLVDGPLPAHFEPHESPVRNPLYGQQSNPARQTLRHPLNPDNPAGRFPFVATTYRLTEHHTAGGMTRFLPVLNQLQPEMFCEVSPELAAERGLEHGGWATISTSRSQIEARVLVTERVRPLRVERRVVHQIGLPYHWGSRGLIKGDSANDLFPMVLDPNEHIEEVKACTCDIRPGRRPR